MKEVLNDRGEYIEELVGLSLEFENKDINVISLHTAQDVRNNGNEDITVLKCTSSYPAPINEANLKLMKRGSVIVDVAIDQGGCVETSKPTTHGDPTYIVDDIVHYCVANMPGGVPRTSTFALNQATLPYLVKLANKGYQKALSEDKNFLAGLNVCKGEVTYKAVADVFGYKYAEPLNVI